MSRLSPQQSSLEFLTRRRLLELSGAGYLGLNLGGLWRAEAAGVRRAVDGPPPVRSCILIFFYGGPSHLETFDLKPQAPAEVRGEFQPIATSVPGLQISEHLPYLSRWMHKVALVRSVYHNARLHDSASIHALTGRPLEGPDRELFAPLPQFYPSYGSAISALTAPADCDVPFAALPFAFRNVHEVPCQGGGILGSRFDPLRIEVDGAAKKYQVEMLKPAEGVDSSRSSRRRSLLAALEPHDWPGASLDGLYERAYRLLEAETIRSTLDITREVDAVRQRYGIGSEAVPTGEGGGGGNGAEMGYSRHMRGQNFLLARRLVESGVPFVNVYDFRQQGQNWDAHFKCFNQHKSHLLPQMDQGVSALIEDLEQRGLLESTLVVGMGEFGRTPKINGDGGRDHWPDCYTVFFAGGGVQGGSVYGSSDKIGAYPATDPVAPADLAATIYWRFGIDPATEIHDHAGRPHKLSEGTPLRRLFEGSEV